MKRNKEKIKIKRTLDRDSVGSQVQARLDWTGLDWTGNSPGPTAVHEVLKWALSLGAGYPGMPWKQALD